MRWGLNGKRLSRFLRLLKELPAPIEHLLMIELARDSLKLEGKLVDRDERDHYISRSDDVVAQVPAQGRGLWHRDWSLILSGCHTAHVGDRFGVEAAAQKWLLYLDLPEVGKALIQGCGKGIDTVTTYMQCRLSGTASHVSVATGNCLQTLGQLQASHTANRMQNM
jgi:hypothetical protein